MTSINHSIDCMTYSNTHSKYFKRMILSNISYTVKQAKF